LNAAKEPERTATTSRGRTYGAYQRRDERAPANGPAGSRADMDGDRSEPRATASSRGKSKWTQRKK
jgi:hypothetical protein